MAYAITFTKGSLKGRKYVVGAGETMSIGRSHSCGIRPKEADVSGKHAILRENGGILEIEVLSSHKTAIDGIRLAQGEKRILTPGSSLEFGGSLICSICESRDDGDNDTLGGTGTLGGTETYGGETRETAATRAAMVTSTLGDSGDTGTLATVATRAGVATSTLARATATLGDAGETAILGGPETATLGAGGATQTVATAATRAVGETGTLATAATRAAGVGRITARPARRTRPIGVEPDDAETQMSTGLTPPPPAQSDTEIATGDTDGGETQMLATQAISQTELNILRGAHIRNQKRKIGLRAVAFIIAFAAIFSLYAWLSHPMVKTYLAVPATIAFDGVIRTEGGFVTVDLPNSNGGKATVKSPDFVRWDLRLGDKWEVPFTVMLTNYVDKASLREDCEESFARWRMANMVGLWRDQGELRIPQFLGGLGGTYPGVRCIVHKYTRVDEDGENLAGTAAFFRTGDVCHVLLRELPAAEESRGHYWLDVVEAVLFVRRKGLNGENLFSARHWEGTSATDDERDPALVLKECRERLESDDVTAWNDVERMLYVTLRTIEGRDDDDARDIRTGALDALQHLRKAQAAEWTNCQREAFKMVNRPGGEGAKALLAIRERARDLFNSSNDERHFLIGLDNWWRVKPEVEQ